MHRESQIDPQLLAALVRHELDQLDTATSVRLVVSPDALAYWNEAASSMPRKVEVIADRTVASGTLRMETALGSTSIDFEHELKEIECGFFDLLSHRPSSEDSRAARVQ
jgi:flagellar assembly protein FliH